MEISVKSLAVTFTVFALSFTPRAQAVSPPPDGCYPNYTTAEGCNALNLLTSGAGNTGVGWYSLSANTTGGFNTALGAGALVLNNGDSNTAVGAAALLLNTTGTENTAIGTDAMVYNDTGSANSALGTFALFRNADGGGNTAVGYGALFGNTAGFENTAVGSNALSFNTEGTDNTAIGEGALGFSSNGSYNTAVGEAALFNNAGDDNAAIGLQAMYSNHDGIQNTAVGSGALLNNTSGISNTAIGAGALYNTSGDSNSALGAFAGINVFSASNVICIGANGADVSNTTWVGNVYGVTTQSGTTAQVIVSDNGQLGTVASSERFKKDIATMDHASEVILSLRPVTFHYKSDTRGTPQFGLIAEEVAKINPALVLPDKEGKPYTVRYDAVNAMLLNEFLKEHRKVEELKSAMAQQRKTTEALVARLNEQEARIQKVSAQVEARKPMSQMLVENQ